MTDDGIRRALAENLPLPGDLNTEAALTRTRTLGRQRDRRRRWMAMAAPVGAASAVVAVVLIARAGSTSQPPPVTSTPTPSVVGLEGGQWYRHVTGTVRTPTGPVDVSAVWVIRLSSTTRGTFEAKPTSRFGSGSLTYDVVGRVWVIAGLKQCGNALGRYRITRAGTDLTFAHVDDACSLRATVLDNNAFAPLTNPDQLNG